MTPGKTLLVVEDDSITREGLGLLLRREDYDVIQAANGEEALACLRSGPPPDLILLDMLLPVLDGWHFLQQIRAEGAPPIPIMVVTSTVLTRQVGGGSRLLRVRQEAHRPGSLAGRNPPLPGVVSSDRGWRPPSGRRQLRCAAASGPW